MSVKKDPSGRRSVEVDIEVPGTPEEVWQAIATGPGVSSWFVPTEVVEKDGKKVVVAHLGPGMDAVATQTAWEPPRRFAAESQDLGPDAPTLATEWIVEARSGGTCVVRVVHSLFASTDNWDDQLSGFESGWPAFLQTLRLYMTHFRGQQCSMFQVMGFARETDSRAWATVAESLGFSGTAVGETWVRKGVPRCGGRVEEVGQDKHWFLTRLDEPAPGIMSLNVCAMGGRFSSG